MAARPSVPVSRSSNALASLANGGAAVYWSAPSSYGSFQLCVALLLSAYAVVLTNAKYRIRGQYSIDGVTWLNLGSDGYIDGQTTAITATGAFSNQYAGEQSEFGALLRVGIEVISVDGSSQGFAQINVDAAPLDTGLVANTRLQSGNLALSGTPAILGTNVSTTPFPKCRVSVLLAANAPDTLTIYVKTGKADCLATVTTGTITAGNRDLSLEATTLGAVTAVYYKTGGSWTTTSAIVDIAVRPE